ncbi:MAG: sigma-70 family RNA polymerase sigma factor [Planctomycetota bacterium]
MSASPADAARGCDRLPDRELVALCLDAGQKKDEAFAALYGRYADRVFGFLLKVTYDRALAEEALQETFLRVYKSLDRFDPQRPLLGWLFQIARYVAIDAYRVEAKVKRLEEQRMEESPVASDAGEIEEVAQESERQTQVDRALRALTPDDRSLLLMRHYQDMTFREIGELTQCSSRTAQNRVKAAAQRLQAELCQLRAGGEA